MCDACLKKGFNSDPKIIKALDRLWIDDRDGCLHLVTKKQEHHIYLPGSYISNYQFQTLMPPEGNGDLVVTGITVTVPVSGSWGPRYSKEVSLL